MREMIFFFLVCPRALAAYQANLIWVSLASEPEQPKNTLPTGKGAISFSFSASATRRLMALAGEEMAVGELAHLLGRGFGQFVRRPSPARCTTGPTSPRYNPCRRCR